MERNEVARDMAGMATKRWWSGMIESDILAVF
jgi:hypothetical protein